MARPDHRGPAGTKPIVAVPVVITRPLEDARVLADTLRARGREVILAPVLEIRPVDFDPSVPKDLDGMIVTSANGADALARLQIRRDATVWAVGTATGQRARAAGFTDVRDGAGTAADLVEDLRAELGSASRHLLWLSGQDIRVDLSAALSGSTISVERRVAYAAVEVERFDADLCTRLRATTDADIVFFSPRSARHFVRVLGETLGLPHITRWRAVCFSASIADALVEETALAQAEVSGDPARWSSVTAAEAPTRVAMLTALIGDDPPAPTRTARDGHDEEGDGRMTEKDNSSVTGADPDKIDAESATGADDSGSGPWGADTVAAESGDDSLIGGDGNDRTEDVVREDSSDADTTRPTATTVKSSGGGRFLVTLILIALIGVGLYATYPVWRQHALPYAEQVGVTLPPVETAADKAPEQAAAASDTAAPAVPDSAQATQATPTATRDAEVAAPAPKAEPEPAPEPTAPAASDSDIDALTERLDTMAQDIAALKAAPASAAPDGDVTGQVTGLQAQIDDTQRTLSTFGDELAILRDNLGGDSDGNGIGPLAAELSSKLADMGTRLEALETKTPARAVSPEDFAELSGTVSELSGRLDRALQEEAAARGTLSAKLDGIKAEVGKLSTAIADTRSDSEQAGAFLIAANQLALASSRSGGFSAELEAAAVAGGDAGADVASALDTLKTFSGGVPSRTVLRDTYPRVATDILDADLVGINEGFVGAALRNVAALVSVRRTTSTGGDSLDELVTSAENAVRAGDLQAAVDTLSRLEGVPAQAAARWLADAKDRLAVDQAVGVLQSAAIANISGG